MLKISSSFLNIFFFSAVSNSKKSGGRLSKMNFNKSFLIVFTSALAFSHGIEIRCEFGDRNWGLNVGNAYTCDKARLSAKNNPTTLESIQGNHLEDRKNSDVKALLVQGDETSMLHLPLNIENFFPNLEVFVWEYGNLTSVTVEDFRPFSQLKILYLGVNRIVTLDENLFQQTPRLSLISFQANQITNIGSNLLANLNELTRVYFGSNPCIDFIAETPADIYELKQKLINQCPLLTTTIQPTTTLRTTTEGTCNVRCTLDDEVDELVNALVDQNNLIVKSERRIIELEDLVANSEKRILELEKQMREVLSRP